MHNKTLPLAHFAEKYRSRMMLMALCVALMWAVRVGAQVRAVSPSLPTLPSGAPVGSRDDYDIPSSDPIEEQRRLRALNAQRQKRVASDANKILRLTRELNTEIAGAQSESLTPSQFRKLAQIEKLARDLKANMSAVLLPSTDIQPSKDPRLQ